MTQNETDQDFHQETDMIENETDQQEEGDMIENETDVPWNELYGMAYIPALLRMIRQLGSTLVIHEFDIHGFPLFKHLNKVFMLITLGLFNIIKIKN